MGIEKVKKGIVWQELMKMFGLHRKMGKLTESIRDISLFLCLLPEFFMIQGTCQSNLTLCHRLMMNGHDWLIRI